MLDALPGIAVIVDVNGVIVAVNRRWRHAARQRGGSDATCGVGVNYLDVCRRAGEAGVAPASALRDVLTGRRQHFELSYPCAAPGDEGWASVEAMPLPDGSSRALVLHRQTTPAVAAGAAREASESRLRSIFEASGLALAITDLRGVALDVNPRLCAMLGYGRDELLGRNLVELKHPDEPLRTELFHELLNGSKDQIVAEGRYVRKDGQVLVGRLTTAAVRDESGQVHLLVGTVEDVTDHRRGADRAATAEAEMRVVVEAAPVAIIGLDREQRARTWNPAAERMFGWSQAEIVGRPLPIHCEEDARFSELWATVLQGGSFAGIDAVRCHRDGSPISVSLSAAPVTDEAGTITGTIGVLLDVTERKAFESKLAHMVLHDSLTGLPNRTLLLDRIAHAVDRAARDRRHVALLCCDLDRFKVLNDSMGHSAGDQLLVTVAERLCEIMRLGDTVARLGGDEFAVLCEDLDGPDDAAATAGRLLEAMREPVRIDGGDFVVSMSVGIAVSDGIDMTPQALLRDADAAMFRAKARGRNRHEVFDQATRAAAVSRLELESELRRAVTAGELAVHYQPIVDLASGGTVGVEALVRWHHPERGLVPPNDFVPVAEEIGLIVPIGRFVLEEAIRQIMAWNQPGQPPLFVSVNLSARQLLDPAFPRLVAEAIAANPGSSDLVYLEITESVLMEDAHASALVLDRLRQLGPRLMVDDFGTGYSSLAYLRDFPLDGLKLDRTFVAATTAEHQDRAIPAAVASLAFALSLDTLAEGVETTEQLEAMQAIGYQLGQGFLWSRPLPADALTDWLAAHR